MVYDSCSINTDSMNCYMLAHSYSIPDFPPDGTYVRLYGTYIRPDGTYVRLYGTYEPFDVKEFREYLNQRVYYEHHKQCNDKTFPNRPDDLQNFLHVFS